MLIEKPHNYGVLFTDEVVSELLNTFGDLTYELLLKVMSQGAIKVSEDTNTNVEKSIKFKSGTIMIPFIETWNIVTYRNETLKFSNTVANVYLDTLTYQKERKKQCEKFS